MGHARVRVLLGGLVVLVAPPRAAQHDPPPLPPPLTIMAWSMDVATGLIAQLVRAFG